MASNVGQDKSAMKQVLPRAIVAAIARGQKAFEKTGRFEIKHDEQTLRTLPGAQKLQHVRDHFCTVIAMAAEGGRGHPPRAERLRAATIIADHLEAKGVPFRVGRNSRMNKLLRKQLNEMADPTDHRKSRRKEINAEAVRAVLKQVRKV